MARAKKRKDGRYSKQIYIGKDEQSKRITKTVYGKTVKEVETAAAAINVKLNRGISLDKDKDTFEQWRSRFVIQKNLSGIGQSQINNINLFSKHLAPLDSMPLGVITVNDVQAIIYTLNDWHDGKKPLAKRTLKGIKQTASQVFEFAIAARAVDFNPAKYVTVPKTAAETQRTAIEEYQRQWIPSTPHRAQRAAMLMLYAGLRRGEALALLWSDVDFKNATIHVTKSLELTGTAAVLKSPKTAAGTRNIPIPSVLVDFLQAEKANDTCTIVCHNHSGSYMTFSSFKALWHSYMQDLNVKYGYDNKANKHAANKINSFGVKQGGLPIMIKTFTAHQLRHTYATMLFEAGVDVVAAKDMLGHADISTTLGIYTHLQQNLKQINANRFNEYLQEKNQIQVKFKSEVL